MPYITKVSFSEDGFNKIIGNLISQRPSTFNYGTNFFHLNPSNFCEYDGTTFYAPYSTKMEAIEFPGIEKKLQYCFQIRSLNIDFHPKTFSANDIDIPSQSFQVYLKICLGIQFDNSENICSCFSIITSGKFLRVFDEGIEFLVPKIDLITIPEIEPISLRGIFEKIVTQTLNNKIFEEMRTSVNSISFQLGDSFNFQLTLSPELPNPSISKDILSIKMIKD